MSIKRKLIISNIVMILIPVLFLLFMGTLFAHAFRLRAHNDQSDAAPDIRRVMELTDGTRDTAAACAALEQGGASVRLANAAGPLYESADFAERAENSLLGGNARGVAYLTAASASGSEFYIRNNGLEAHVFSDKAAPVARLDRSGEYESSLRGATIAMLLSTVCLTLALNWILTTLLARSVLNPLKILHEGTHRIACGDLEQAVVYGGKDEFGQVCADFEDMRVRLRQTVLERHAFEESKKELIAGISHDLLTPLTHIKGYVAGILDGVANTPEKVDSYLRTINHSADTMRKMVDDLFLFSKLDIESIALYFELTDLVPFIAACCQELRPELDGQNMDLFFEARVPRAFALLEKDQFRRVLRNIAENSVKYKKEGRGSLTVTVDRNQSEVTVAFEDRGAGVEAAKLPHIFEIFYRTDAARSETGKGSGLGLAIVKQVVGLHNGHVSARCEPGGGLAILVSLPNAREGADYEKNTDN